MRGAKGTPSIGVSAHRAFDRKAAAEPRELRPERSISAYHSTADTEPTAPQIVTQSPSDNSNTTIKDAPISCR
jgi:hypothetical protein